ncbi:MAG: phosphoribosylformylglycinamidine cyclo-ligase [Erysipelotrichales bacterium]|nr:phosphoribosylformylglycinamidine cyclo-ligase [Erysipelotrichales bacterium]
MSKKYQEAGVSLDAGYDAVERIKKQTMRTNRLGMMKGFGSFGGMFDLSALNYKNPVLVSGTDGVGTKLLLAIEMDKHDTIGEDLVAMCVNDILAQGAEPLYFLDYIATDKVIPEKVEAIVSGIANGCMKAGCALIGGETAEMSNMYAKDHYDLAGFAVGAVEKEQLITGEDVEVGDLLIGLASSGIHSNGYSLVRKIIQDNKLSLSEHYDLGASLGDVVLAPTRIYVKPILELMKKVKVKALMNITGGGFVENLPRGIKKTQGIKITKGSWPVPKIFKLLEDYGQVSHQEMYEIFNMGIGLTLVVKKSDAEKVMEILHKFGETSYLIGSVTDKPGVVIE